MYFGINNLEKVLHSSWLFPPPPLLFKSYFPTRQHALTKCLVLLTSLWATWFRSKCYNYELNSHRCRFQWNIRLVNRKWIENEVRGIFSRNWSWSVLILYLYVSKLWDHHGSSLALEWNDECLQQERCRSFILTHNAGEQKVTISVDNTFNYTFSRESFQIGYFMTHPHTLLPANWSFLSFYHRCSEPSTSTSRPPQEGTQRIISTSRKRTLELQHQSNCWIQGTCLMKGWWVQTPW